ncbi:DJ-1/PfpI family protein [Paenibacillus sp. 481]|uniref:DJ-1/PfpI family protein n=1 Tax=Paenibacillus sp. 481 TaxID=2835869 RepID=UPI001E4CB4EB|nr:DJ-1/PfpI family protein [Paenibacillus sp. 481]UHA75174.1 DJ-1/PfpI family protein [Paenibacillus sp. 481]
MKTKKTLFIIPPERFNEVELFYPQSILEGAGIKVTIGSTVAGDVIGDFNGKATAEVAISDVKIDEYDAVAVIGGSGTIDHLWDNEPLLQLLKQAHEQHILVSGICAGSVSVVKTGLLNGRAGTCYPVDVMINELKSSHVEYVVQHVVKHNDIITSDGPDGAKDFGHSLVEALA